MPTASKLAAAVLTAVFGFVIADLIIPHLPEQDRLNRMHEATVVLGILVGWRFLGPRTGAGFRSAVGLGLSTALVLFVTCLLYFSFYEMIIRSLRKSYDGPFEGLEGMVTIAIENLEYVQFSDVVTGLIVGGVLVGLVTELVARRWS